MYHNKTIVSKFRQQFESIVVLSEIQDNLLIFRNMITQNFILLIKYVIHALEYSFEVVNPTNFSDIEIVLGFFAFFR